MTFVKPFWVFWAVRTHFVAEPWVSIEDHWQRSMEILWALAPAAENHDVRLITHPGGAAAVELLRLPQLWTDMMDLVPRPASLSYASTGPGKAAFQSSTGLKYH